MERENSDEDIPSFDGPSYGPNSFGYPLMNVSQDPLLSNARITGHDCSLTDIAITNTPADEVEVQTSENSSAEIQKLEKELADIQKRNQELARQKLSQAKEKREADLRKQIEDAKRVQTSLEVATNSQHNQDNHGGPVDKNNQAGGRVEEGVQPPPIANTKQTTLQVSESEEDERYYTPKNRPLRRKNRDRSRSPHRRAPAADMDKLTEVLMKLTSQPKPVVLKQKPPMFDGVPVKARLWLKGYLIAANINKWTSVEKSQYLSTSFTGAAKVWFEGRFDGKIPDWDNFESIFNEVYKPVGYNEDKMSEFYTTKQTDEENPIEYLDRMVRLRNEIDPKPTDQNVVKNVRRGLKGRYASIAIKINDMNELRSTLREALKLYENSDKERKLRQKPTVSQNSRPNPPSQDAKQTARPTVTLKPASEFKMTCYNCDKVGHLSKNCPEPYDQDKVTQNFANLYNARNPNPSNGGPRNNWRPPQNNNYVNRSNRPPNNSYNLRNNQPAPAAPSAPPAEETQPLGRQNMFKNKKKTVEEKVRRLNRKVFPMTYVDIVIGSRKIEALIDTGGAFSLISIDLVIALNLNFEPSDTLIRGVGETHIDSLGSADPVIVLFDNFVITMPFTIVTTLYPHVILGIDFIRAMNLTIYPNANGLPYSIVTSATGRTPCSDSEVEEEVKHGRRPPFRVRHMTKPEQTLAKGIAALPIKIQSQRERDSYLRWHLQRGQNNQYSRAEPDTTNIPNPRYVRRDWANKERHQQYIERMERELTQENERRESDSSYRRHRENVRREKEINDQLIGNESCWSLEPLRMELHAIEEAELRRPQRLIRRDWTTH